MPFTCWSTASCNSNPLSGESLSGGYNCDYSESQGKLDQFWRGTGFSPAELLLTQDMRQPLTYVASVPHRGIEYVQRVVLEAYHGMSGQREVTVYWLGFPSYNLRTYAVQTSPNPDFPYQPVNSPDLLCTAFLHVVDPSQAALYDKVFAVDYLGLTISESQPAVVELQPTDSRAHQPDGSSE